MTFDDIDYSASLSRKRQRCAWNSDKEGEHDVEGDVTSGKQKESKKIDLMTHRDNDTRKQPKATNRDTQQSHKIQKETFGDKQRHQQPPTKGKETFRDNLATLETKRDISRHSRTTWRQ